MTPTSDQSVDLNGMITGIRRWVETESPTNNQAAVNRMIDVVMADLGGLPVRVERVKGQRGFADMLKVRTAPDSTRPASWCCRTSTPCTRSACWPARCRFGATATSCTGRASTT